jgi:transposase
MTQVEVAETFGLGVRTIRRYLSRWRENGQFARGKFGGHKKHLLAAHAERVRQLVTAAPDLTLAALCERLAAQGIQVSTSALDRFLRATGLTYKKKRWSPPNKSVATCRRRGAPGKLSKSSLSPPGWCSSTKPG